MKEKRLVWILVAVLLLGGLSGCGAAAKDEAAYDVYDDGYYFSNGTADSAPAEDVWVEDAYYDDGESDMVTTQGSSVASGTGAIVPDLSEKIIYSASAELETVTFDDTVLAVEQMVARYGAFLESSYVEGVDYYSSYYADQTYRTAQFTIRVPVENYNAMTGGLSSLGHVVGIRHYAENVTAQYTDLESRLTAYETEEATLLSMLEQAETVTDLLEIQTRLSEVRYQIEYYTSTLRNLQNQISYSTVDLTLYEVRELTETVEPQLTYWEEMAQGFHSSMRRVGRVFKNGFMDVVANLPMILLVLAFVAVIFLVPFFIIRHAVRKAKKRQQERLMQYVNPTVMPPVEEHREE